MESVTSSSLEWKEETVFAVLDEQYKKIHQGRAREINKKKLGEFHRLVHELRNDPRRFHIQFRTTKDEFDYIRDLIKEINLKLISIYVLFKWTEFVTDTRVENVRDA